MATHLVSTALKLNLPDHLGDGVRTSDELAERTGTHAESLARLLRALASVGLAREVKPGSFELTSAGRRLRADVPNSLRAMAALFTDESMSRAWPELHESVRTGQPAFAATFGTDYYTHLSQDSTLAGLFNEAHGQSARRAADAVAQAYDFAGARMIVDIGGGDGTLLAAILAAAPGTSQRPGPRGIVYDTTTGLQGAAGTLGQAGVAGRCEIRPGDFRVDVPSGADIYLIKSTLHNLDDEDSAAVLRNCRHAMPGHARLLLVETVMPPMVDPDHGPFAYFSDLNMLVNLGGRERTEAEFAALLSACGFEIGAVVPLNGSGKLGLQLIEAIPR